MDVHGVLREVRGGIEVFVTVSANSDLAGTDGVNEWRKRLEVRVSSPPVGGKANREVEEYFSRVTGCRTEIIKGRTSRMKTIMIHGDPGLITDSLEGLL